MVTDFQRIHGAQKLGINHGNVWYFLCLNKSISFIFLQNYFYCNICEKDDLESTNKINSLDINFSYWGEIYQLKMKDWNYEILDKKIMVEF